jgi:anti-sigma regulatory factor (Ser/Thr protein kinase)
METLDSITVPAKIENLNRCVELVSSCAKKLGFGKNTVNRIELATEEAIVNIFKYSYRDCDGDVEISCKSGQGDVFIIEIKDSGVPFNLLDAPELHFTPDKDFANHRVGGLGIFLIRSTMDEIKYKRETGTNILTLSVSEKR